MTRLNQLIAVRKGVGTQATREFTTAHRLTQQPEPFTGISRVYQPRDADGDELPAEATRVQASVERINADVARTLTRLFDVVATIDVANATTKAEVIVDGQVLISDLPPPTLLFLEKQLTDLRTYVDKLPTLDPAFGWSPDPTSGDGVSRTASVSTTRTQKVPTNHVLYEATKEHPAQVQVFNVDKIVGDWTTVRFSGAITESRRHELQERVDKLLAAVKFAREEANSIEVTDVKIGEAIFEYLLA